MSRVHSSDTSLEIKVRKYLYHEGFRYRKNVRDLPGKPDIVVKKFATVIFVNGCFWHRHMGCPDSTIPKTNTEYWIAKFSKTIARDRSNITQLQNMGWKVIIIWECEVKQHFQALMKRVICDIIMSNLT